MKIEMELDDLNNYGISQLASEMMGKGSSGIFDWASAGKLIEELRINIMYTGETSEASKILSIIRGAVSEPWCADMKANGRSYSMFGESALFAIAKTYMAFRVTEGSQLKVDTDQALALVKKPDNLKFSLCENSDAHTAEEMEELNTYKLIPVSSSISDLENFQRVVRLARQLQGYGVTILKEHMESDSGKDFVDTLLIQLR